MKIDTHPAQWPIHLNAWHPTMSNFTPMPITWAGFVWPTNEHAFAAAKTLDHEAMAAIRNAPTPGKAKRLGRKVALRPGWDEGLSIDVMVALVATKAAQHPAFRATLTATSDRPIIEVTSWGDTRWGTNVTGNGANILGQILMHERSKGHT